MYTVDSTARTTQHKHNTPFEHSFLIPKTHFPEHFTSLSWLGWPLWNINVTNDHGYVLLVVNTFRSFPHSRLVTELVSRLTRRMPLVVQELPTIPEHMSSSPVFNGIHVTRSLVLCVWYYLFGRRTWRRTWYNSW
jgi:hypothetical protein